MAREYAKLKTAIWGDDDYRALPVDAQWLYQYLFSSPKIDICGVTEWDVRKIAAKAADLTIERVEAAGALLHRSGFIVIDVDTCEVLVRTFIKHDGSLKGWKTAKGVANAWADVSSSTIRTVIAHECVKIRDANPDWSGSAEVTPHMIEKASGYVPDTLSDPYPNSIERCTSDTNLIPLRCTPDTPSGTEPILPIANSYPPIATTQKRSRAAQPLYTPDFDRFWQAYPRKRDKKKAAEAFRSAISRANVERIIQAAGSYATEQAGTSSDLVKLGATWLNGDCWENEPEPHRIPPPAQQPNHRDDDDFQGDLYA